MNFNSFILSGSSIIGRNISDLINSSNDRLSVYDMRKRGENSELSKSGVSQDEDFFRTEDPDVDPITDVDVLRAVPFGRFHYFISVIYFILFVSTSTLAFNFAFFLMPQAY